MLSVRHPTAPALPAARRFWRTTPTSSGRRTRSAHPPRTWALHFECALPAPARGCGDASVAPLCGVWRRFPSLPSPHQLDDVIVTLCHLAGASAAGVAAAAAAASASPAAAANGTAWARRLARGNVLPRCAHASPRSQ